MSDYYPVYLNLKGRRCVVFGGGAVAEDKILKLQTSGAIISVISPDVTPVIQSLSEQGKLDWQPRKYQPGDLAGAFMAIAATNNRDVNRCIFEEAEESGILLNVVDDPVFCSFIAPAIVRRGNVTLAISTGGASPALARKLRESLEESPALEWADLASVMSRVRREVRRMGLSIDRQRWQCGITHKILKLAQAGLEDEAVDSLLEDLTNPDNREMCSELDRCGSEPCALLRQTQVDRVGTT